MKDTTKARREETMKARLIAFVFARPGCDATAIPAAYRRFIREMEKDAGFLVWKDNGWHVTGMEMCQQCGQLTRYPGDDGYCVLCVK